MNTTEAVPGSRSTFASVLRDTHFWVPTIVLLAGLVLLRWVS
jgi:hypothetical protein